jgi:hypothetical protein
MQRLSAQLPREIIDWIVFYTTQLYGDERDVAPTDCDEHWLEDWHYRSMEATHRRASLADLSDDNLLSKGLYWYEIEQKRIACLPRGRGRPKGAGYAESDQQLLGKISKLMREGHSLHGATQQVAEKAAGGSTKDSKARRLARRFLEKK